MAGISGIGASLAAAGSQQTHGSGKSNNNSQSFQSLLTQLEQSSKKHPPQAPLSSTQTHHASAVGGVHQASAASGAGIKA